MKAKVIEQETDTRQLKDGQYFTVEEAARLLKKAKKRREKMVAELGFDPAIEGGEMTVEQFKKYSLPKRNAKFYTIEEGKELIRLWRELEKK